MMPSPLSEQQEREWLVLYDRISETLKRFGKENAFGEGDYWLVDDNLGLFEHRLEIQNLKLLQPQIIKLLQSLLANHPDWAISVAVDVPGKEKEWPGMGVVIYADEIIDELRREFLPEEFRTLFYE